MNGRTVAGKRQLCNKRIYTMIYKNVKHYAQNAEKNIYGRVLQARTPEQLSKTKPSLCLLKKPAFAEIILEYKLFLVA